jgi:hypothetical protein
MNVRASYSQTVARPESPRARRDLPKLPGERERRGNPDLVQTDITSYDLRWEWFFSPLELVSRASSTRTSRARSRASRS